MEITKEQFQAYEDVGESGITNMFDSRVVSKYSGLNREQIVEIMKRYEDLMTLYPEVRS